MLMTHKATQLFEVQKFVFYDTCYYVMCCVHVQLESKHKPCIIYIRIINNQNTQLFQWTCSLKVII